MSRPVIIMAAPNGAHKTRRDHPALPITLQQTVDEAVVCRASGASMLHAHVRDQWQQHSLDSNLYLTLFSELKNHTPDLLLQMTTESAGKFSPEQQVNSAREVKPEFLTMAVREIASEDSQLEFARQFYHWAFESHIHVQHIVFDQDDLTRFWRLHKSGIIPEPEPCLLYVLGRYNRDFHSTPEDLKPFLDVAPNTTHSFFVCAFGRQEFDCAVAAIEAGGHARIGFENNLYRKDGSVADNTADNISELADAINQMGYGVATPEQARRILHPNVDYPEVTGN